MAKEHTLPSATSPPHEAFALAGKNLRAIADAPRRDLDALVEANQVAADAMQALARKQAALMTQAMQALQQAAQGAALGLALGDPTAPAALATKTFEQAVADLNGVAEMLRNAQADAMAHLTLRTRQRVREMKALVRPG